MIFLLSGALTLSTIHFATAFPVLNRQTEGITVQDATTSAYTKYLQSMGEQPASFYPLLNVKDIDFAGIGNSSNMFETNSDIFTTADSIHEHTSFSTRYLDFIRALLNVTISIPPPDAESKQLLSNLASNFSAACEKDLLTAKQNAYMAYKKQGGTATISDDAFLQFAIHNYTQYEPAVQKCNDTRNAFTAAENNMLGDNQGILQESIPAVNPIIAGLSKPGVTMPVPANNSPNNTLVPYYAMPSLNSVLTGWQTGPTDGPPAFTWNSVTSNGGRVQTRKPLTLARGNDPAELIQATAIDLSFGGIGLIDIEHGTWFDDFKSANALEHPPANDPVAGAHKSLFAKHFGTEKAPGPVSTYNKRAWLFASRQSSSKTLDCE
ncbi:hypothetical protein DFH09DRAFT_1344759 [Mycena vulgaris]|nr:hypothetical protein DFH09DRAFT_1344759 [Mycena vulgaris]